MDLLETRSELGVVTLTLNRPHRRNAFDSALVQDLTTTLRRLEADEEARVVVITGAGENFCAGGDVEWMRRAADAPAQENVRDALALTLMFQVLDQLSKPTVAIVQGAVFGGGVGLVACCDIAVAAHSAKFSLSEVRLGIVPAVVGPYLVKAVGARQARALFLSAEIVSADRAFHIGLVHEVASDGALIASRERVLEALLLGAPGAQAKAKALVALCTERPLDMDLMRETADILAERRASAEGREGLTAFLEKRAPGWQAKGGG